MRADRLVSLVLLLRQHGRMSATTLARELEVSTRTVVRDIEALSAAGVPVYAERGRRGGFALLPGFRTELTGLTHDETLAVMMAGGRTGQDVFGLGPALASAMRKVVDALPDDHRTIAADTSRRLLVEPPTDLLERRVETDQVPAAVLSRVRRAVGNGQRLRIRYRAADQTLGAWRTIDPIGMVTVRGRGYLLATRAGEDRTYRTSRIEAADVLDEPASRDGDVDLDRLWRERSARFRISGEQVTAHVRVDARRQDELLDTALAVHAREPVHGGGLDLDVTFQDARHAVWALWQLGVDAEALTPEWLRDALRTRALAIAARYDPT